MAHKRKPLLMMRTRSLVGPGVKQGNKKLATVKNRSGVKTVGNFILYKENNP